MIVKDCRAGFIPLSRLKPALHLIKSMDYSLKLFDSFLGSGMNDHKKGLKKLWADIIAGPVERRVIVHKERLLRFGGELIFAICECKDVEVVIMNKGQETTFEEDLTQDVLEIITVFSARLYGSRSHKNKKIMEAVQKAVENVA